MWFWRSGYVMVLMVQLHDALLDLVLVVAFLDHVVVFDEVVVRARCDLLCFWCVIFVFDDAMVQLVRLALGLRDRVAKVGVVVYERLRVWVLRCEAMAVVVETVLVCVRAGAVVLVINAVMCGFLLLCGRVLVTLLYIVLTELVLDVVEVFGWIGGECIIDARTFVHYFCITLDGWIVFGWGGGRVVPGVWFGGCVEVDSEVVEMMHEHLVMMFFVFEGCVIMYVWGGLIDVLLSYLL